MIPQRPHRLDRLKIRGQADLHGDTPIGDILHEPIHIRLPIDNPGILDLARIEQPGPVTNAVSVAIGEGLEDRLGPLILPGMDGLPEERLVGVQKGLRMILGGIPVLPPRQIHTDDGDPPLVLGPHTRVDQGLARQAEELVLAQVLEDLQHVPEYLGEPRGKVAQRGHDDPGPERRLTPARHSWTTVEALLGPLNPLCHGGEDLGDGAILPRVELGGEPHLEVAHPLLLAVDAELVSRPLQ